jgi:hypothetical protein
MSWYLDINPWSFSKRRKVAVIKEQLLNKLAQCATVLLGEAWGDVDILQNASLFQPIGSISREINIYSVSTSHALSLFLESNQNHGNWLIMAWRYERSLSMIGIDELTFKNESLDRFALDNAMDFAILSGPDDVEWLVYERNKCSEVDSH